ncbi:hypothetical protein Tco_0794089 [Tanacetum coccineum]
MSDVSAVTLYSVHSEADLGVFLLRIFKGGCPQLLEAGTSSLEDPPLLPSLYLQHLLANRADIPRLTRRLERLLLTTPRPGLVGKKEGYLSQVECCTRESSEFCTRHHDAQKDRAAVRAEIELLLGIEAEYSISDGCASHEVAASRLIVDLVFSISMRTQDLEGWRHAFGNNWSDNGGSSLTLVLIVYTMQLC